MPTLPPGCMTRQELHAIVDRAAGLGEESSGELSKHFADLAVAAARLLGDLCDIEDEDMQRQWPHVFEDPDRRNVEWRPNNFCLHTGKGRFFLSVGQQILRLKNGQYFGTGRFRLKVGEEEDYLLADSLEELRPHAEKYLESFEDVIIPDVRQKCLDQFFGEDQSHAL